MKTRYKNVTVDPDRHGKLRARFRKAGRGVYMKHLPDQPGFQAEYDALVAAKPQSQQRYAPGSVHDLCVRYYRSADYAARGGADDKRRRRGLIESFRSEFGNDLVSDFTFEHIEAILIARSKKRSNDKGRMVGGEVAAVNLRKQLRRLFHYANRKLHWIAINPVEDAGSVGSNKIAGYYTWSEDDIAKFKDRHPVGTKARLALEIMVWTAQRRGDTRLFGPMHIAGGKINFRASKNDMDMWMPIAPDLKRAIEAMPAVGLTTFLVTDFGKPFTAAGFGNWFRERCDEAGLPQCSAHGLRKAAARRMAESNATQQQIKAVGGWKGDAEVSIYVEAANRKLLADSGLSRVVDRFANDEEP